MRQCTQKRRCEITIISFSRSICRGGLAVAALIGVTGKPYPSCLSCHSHPIRPYGAPSPRGEGCDTRIPSFKKGGEAATRTLNPEPNESKVKRGCEEMGIHFFTAPFLLPGMGKGERISAAGASDSSCHAVHPLSISDISSRASMSEPATAGAGRNGKPAWGAGARRPS